MSTSTVVDPVCGMSIDPDTAATREVDGTRYHFCSPHCAASFAADPQRYSAPARQ